MSGNAFQVKRYNVTQQRRAAAAPHPYHDSILHGSIMTKYHKGALWQKRTILPCTITT